MHRIFRGIANFFSEKNYLKSSPLGGWGVFLLLAFSSSSYAQTARKFTLVNSADGKSELTVYLPSEEALAKANGRFVVDCPGGGYHNLAIQHEGHDLAEYYNKQGIGYAVLKYRMPNGDRNIPLSDAYNAIRTVRDSAKVWHVNPKNVGIQGFSAGGHLASAVSTHAPMSARPDFAILFYPVISMDVPKSHKWSCINFLGEEGHKDPALIQKYSTNNAVQSKVTPPAVIVTASDDSLVNPVTNGLEYYKAMHDAGNECALYIYPTGNHGFGFGHWFKYHDQLLNDLGTWLKNINKK